MCRMWCSIIIQCSVKRKRFETILKQDLGATCVIKDTEKDLRDRFGALYGAFKFGAPPHAGMAYGIDRLLMLMLGEDSVREVIAFPLNGNAQDLLLGAPSEVTEQQLRDVHIKVREKH